ncbi:hypothetical protein RUM44_004507 [Polyplax serrata]|uniref:Uncharacterized protein n=1 Tax=Polyplax serrata TaxID=468196 RepID=A0ABR1B324_POLSC
MCTRRDLTFKLWFHLFASERPRRVQPLTTIEALSLGNAFLFPHCRQISRRLMAEDETENRTLPATHVMCLHLNNGAIYLRDWPLHLEPSDNERKSSESEMIKFSTGRVQQPPGSGYHRRYPSTGTPAEPNWILSLFTLPNSGISLKRQGRDDSNARTV